MDAPRRHARSRSSSSGSRSSSGSSRSGSRSRSSSSSRSRSRSPVSSRRRHGRSRSRSRSPPAAAATGGGVGAAQPPPPQQQQPFYHRPYYGTPGRGGWRGGRSQQVQQVQLTMAAWQQQQALRRQQVQQAEAGGAALPFKQFMEALDDAVTPDAAQELYAQHRQRAAAALAPRAEREFFEEHAADGLLRDRYDPAVLLRRWEARCVAAVAAAAACAGESAGDDGFGCPLDAAEYASNAASPQEQAEAEAEAEAESQQQKRALPRAAPHMVVLTAVPMAWSRDDVAAALLAATDGFLGVSLSDPDRGKPDFPRVAWAEYDSEEHAAQAVARLADARIKDAPVHASHLDEQSAADAASRIKYAPHTAAREERLLKDAAQLRALCLHLNHEKGVEVDLALVTPAWNTLPLRTQVDRLILFLRRVHTYCYYCAAEFADEAEMRRKCGLLHLRAAAATATAAAAAAATTDTAPALASEGGSDASSTTASPQPPSTDAPPSDWEADLDAKTQARLARNEGPASFAATEELERALQQFSEENSEKVEEAKYRCTLCSKHFRAPEFVAKHHQLRHVEDVEKVRTRVLEQQYYRNYTADPERIRPQQGVSVSLLPPPVVPPIMGFGVPRAMGSFRFRGRGGFAPRGRPFPFRGPPVVRQPPGPPQPPQQGPVPMDATPTGAPPRPLRTYLDLDNVPEDSDALDFYKSLMS